MHRDLDASGFEFLKAPDFVPDERVRSAHYSWSNQPKMNGNMPAVGGQLVFRIRGASSVQYPGREPFRSQPGECYFIAPSTQAADLEIVGSAHAVGLGFSELGWAELTGLHVDEVKNSVIAARDVFGDEIDRLSQELLREYADGSVNSIQIAQRMLAFIEPRFTRLPDRKRRLIQTTRAWATNELMPDVAELYGALHFSERQVQRYVRRYFGQSPVQVAKRLRAAFAASALNQQNLDEELSDEIADSYYDQSHLIREVKSATGTTPSRLGKREGSLISGILNSDGFLHDEGHVRKIGRMRSGRDQD